MALIEPISTADAKAHLRVTHSDEDSLINGYVSAARRRCEVLTGLTLTIDDEADPVPVIDPVILQAMRTLLAGYYHDRDGNEQTARAETAVQNLLFNARLMVGDFADDD